RARAGARQLVAVLLLLRCHARAEPGRARGAPGLLPDLAATANQVITVRGWRRPKKSLGSGTEHLSGSSVLPEAGDPACDAAADQGTDMTAVTSETVIDPLEQALTD